VADNAYHAQEARVSAPPLNEVTGVTSDVAQPATAGLKPLRAGMFPLPDRLDAPVHLLGGRCRACGEPFFPKRAFCAACTSGDMEDVEFADSGVVETFTVVRQQLPGSAMVPPYAIVRVKLDNGPTVQTVAVNCDPEAIRIGDRVGLVAHRVMDDEAGATVVSFMAQPVGKA
jgi:uncharacterized OB-fold protein